MQLSKIVPTCPPDEGRAGKSLPYSARSTRRHLASAPSRCRAALFFSTSILACGILTPMTSSAEVTVIPRTRMDDVKLELRAYFGDAEAQNELGEWCYNGGGWFGKKNLKRAAYWFNRSAKKGNNSAQRSIAQMYEFGEGVAANHELALFWIRRATIEYSASSMSIAIRYKLGNDSRQPDFKKAVEWYLISANAGNSQAQALLGRLYELGDGVQNISEALKWYRLASSTNPLAMCYLGLLYAYGKGVSKDYTEAARLFIAAAESGSYQCRYELGMLYEQGLGVAQNRITAMEEYQRVAAVNAEARQHLFALYEAGMNLPIDPSKIVDAYVLAAEKGDRWAEEGLGLHYQFGIGVPINITVAYALYQLAARGLDRNPDLPDFIGREGHATTETGRATSALAIEMARPGNLANAIRTFLARPMQPSPY